MSAPKPEAQAGAPLRHAAGIFPVHPGGALLLMLRDDRPEIGERNRWGLVGGHVEAGETPEQAAAREFEEELGRAPARLIAAGAFQHASLSRPGVTICSHLFGSPAAWELDDLILGEGQCVDWFTPAQVARLALTRPLAPAILGFLASDLYRELAGGAPATLPPLHDPLPRDLGVRLGIRRGQLIATRGATAGFVRRLWDALDGARITTSPGEQDQPDHLLWWPRGEAPAPVLAAWRGRMPPGGAVWLMLPPVDACGAGLGGSALDGAVAATRFRRTATVPMPGGEVGVRLTATRDGSGAAHS